MSTNEFAHVGVFVLTALGFSFVTFVFGMLVTDFKNDAWPLFSWLAGVVIYAATISFIWKG